jgi:uncharacterized protein with HEPN domain
MTRETRDRLADISEAIKAIHDHVGGSLVQPDVGTEVVLHAVLFNLLVIGEAAKTIDIDLRGTSPEVPWADYAGLRDIIAHQYFRIQRQIIEDTIRKDLPTLKATIDRLLVRRLPKHAARLNHLCEYEVENGRHECRRCADDHEAPAGEFQAGLDQFPDRRRLNLNYCVTCAQLRQFVTRLSRRDELQDRLASPNLARLPQHA